MLDVVAEHARAMGIRALRGYYLPTKKNGMVTDHYEKLGFEQLSRDPETQSSVWNLNLASYSPGTRHIRILEPANG